MKPYSRLDLTDLINRLAIAGVLPAEAGDSGVPQPAPSWLHIRQQGSSVENLIGDVERGWGTRCCFHLHIAVDQPTFSIQSWELNLPWEHSPVQWLPDPAGILPTINVYQWGNWTGLTYPRDEVINHRHLVGRGHGLDGLLLGYCLTVIPDSYCHGSALNLELALFDEMGRAFSIPVEVYVDRGPKIDRKPKQRKLRTPLFEESDFGEDEQIESATNAARRILVCK